jgi:hypothetical protein
MDSDEAARPDLPVFWRVIGRSDSDLEARVLERVKCASQQAPSSSGRSRRTKRGVDLISDALPFGRLCYGQPDAVSNAIGYAKFRRRSHDAVIRVYDELGNVIETHEHVGDFKEW